MSDKDYVLVIGNLDYADEFDCKCFAVCTKKYWEDFARHVRDTFCKKEELLKDRKFTYDFQKDRAIQEVICFGTNEYLTFESADYFFEQLRVHEISQQEAEIIVKNFDTRELFKKSDFFAWGTGGETFFQRILGWTK